MKPRAEDKPHYESTKKLFKEFLLDLKEKNSDKFKSIVLEMNNFIDKPRAEDKVLPQPLPKPRVEDKAHSQPLPKPRIEDKAPLQPLPIALQDLVVDYIGIEELPEIKASEEKHDISRVVYAGSLSLLLSLIVKFSPIKIFQSVLASSLGALLIKDTSGGPSVIQAFFENRKMQQDIKKIMREERIADFLDLESLDRDYQENRRAEMSIITMKRILKIDDHNLYPQQKEIDKFLKDAFNEIEDPEELLERPEILKVVKEELGIIGVVIADDVLVTPKKSP